ncbi:InlB B-repeat-containing protein [Alistipes indistinctus]|uniref:InlB B-repeat-containing protein n=1 Tax=Alistipes indistinctus TaxID=626932 RepID=UPI0015FD7AAF|nr:InlB B-repeat-containing protein [Alistipes indistinctus]
MKRKLLLLFSLLLLFAAPFWGCIKDDIDVMDHRFDPSIALKGLASASTDESDNSVGYINKPITISLSFNNEIEKAIYKIVASPQTELQGSLSLKESGASVPFDDPFEYKTNRKKDVLELLYTPTTTGDHKITFQITVGGITKTATLEFDCQKPFYNVEFIGLPDKDSIEIERPLDFKMNIEELLGQTDLSKKVKASVTFTKGSGIVSTPTKIWDGLGKGTLLKSVRPASGQSEGTVTRAVAEGETATVFEGTAAELKELAVGENELSILSTGFGDTDVNFTLEADQGSTQEVPMSVKSKFPEFTVAAEALPGRILAGKNMKARVVVDNKKHPTNTEFSISYMIAPKNAVQTPAKAIAKNVPATWSAAMKVAATKAAEVEEDKPVFLKVIRAKGKTTVIETSNDTPTPLAAQTRATTTTADATENTGSASGLIEDVVDVPIKIAGEQVVVMYATDKFLNTNASKDIVIKAEESGFSFYIKEGSQFETTINQPTPFTIVASDMSFQGEITFKAVYTLSKGSGVLKMGDKVIEPGKAFEVISSNAMNFTASTTDEVLLTIKGQVYNAQGEMYDEKEITLSIAPGKNKIEVSVPENVTPSLQQPYKLPVSVSEPYYDGEFTILFERNDGQGVLSTPTASEIAHGASVKAKSGQAVNFTYKPTSAGKHELVFTITDTYGQKEVKTISFTVDDTEFLFTRSEIADVMQTGKASSFTMKLSKEYYPNAAFTVGLLQKKGSGTFKMGSQSVANNGSFTIKKDVETSFSYTPTEAGEHVLQLNIDINGTVIEKVLTFTVPVHIQAAASPAEGGTVTGGGVFDYNTQQSLKVKLADGYSLENWLNASGEAVSRENPYTFTATADGSYTAKLTQNTYKVTLSPFPTDGGSVEGAKDYHYNQEVTIKAKAATGYEFLDWHKDGKTLSLDNPYTFAMPLSPLNITARFGKSSFLVSLSAEAGGEVSGGGRYEFDSEVELTATPATGHAFAGWYDQSGRKISDANPYVYHVKAENVVFRAKFTPINYQITVNATEGGTAKGGGSVAFGSTTQLSATPNTGHQFDGWYDGDRFIGKENPLAYEVTEATNKTIVAKFSPISYAVTVQATTGGTATGGGNVAFGSSTTLKATPETGYEFEAWMDGSKQLSTANPFVYQVSTVGDKVITAKFKVRKFSVTVNADEGGTASGGGAIDYNSETTLKATPATGHSFEGWYIGGSRVSTDNPYQYRLTTAADVTITAKFSVNKYQVTATAGVGGTVTGSGSYDYQANATLRATASAGYTFDYWQNAAGQKASTDNPYIFKVGTSAVTYTAIFKTNNYVLTVSAETGGTVSGGGTYAFGSRPTITATAATGYNFAGWYDGATTISSSPSFTYTIPAANKTLTAKFTAKTYQVSVTAGTGGTASGSGSVKYGASHTVTASANATYKFVGWYEGGNQVSTAASYTFNMPANNRTLEARFALNQFTVTPTSAGGGSVSGGGNNIQAGASTTLRATPDAGRVFDGWYDGDSRVSTANPWTFTVSASKTYQARFSLGSYALNVSTAGGGTVSGGGGSYTYGTIRTITASPATSHNFSHWTKNGIQITGGTSLTISVEEVNNYVAVFTIKRFTVSVTGTNTTGGGTYDYGTNVTVTTAKPSFNYSISTHNPPLINFKGWKENGTVVSSNTSYTFSVTSDRSLSAEWENKMVEVMASIIESGNQIRAYTASPVGSGYITIYFSYHDSEYMDGNGEKGLTDWINITAGQSSASRSLGVSQYSVISNLKITKIISSDDSGYGYYCR